MESKLNALTLPLRKNYQEIDLQKINQKIEKKQTAKTDTNKKSNNKIHQRIGKIEFNNSIIENASFLISNMLIDYVKAGGNLEQLTTKEIYKKKRDCEDLLLAISCSQKTLKKDYDLCWTSQKECDICVVEQSKNKDRKQ
ncbi:MAG: hypothetical protein WCR54_06435 [Clostridia bacterium]